MTIHLAPLCRLLACRVSITNDNLLPSLTWCKCWVENVNVDRNVDLAVSDALLQTVDDSIDANPVYLSGLDHVEPASDVVADVSMRPHHWRSNTRMNRRVADQALFVCYMEECAVVDSLDLTSVSEPTFPASCAITTDTHSVVRDPPTCLSSAF